MLRKLLTFSCNQASKCEKQEVIVNENLAMKVLRYKKIVDYISSYIERRSVCHYGVYGLSILVGHYYAQFQVE